VIFLFKGFREIGHFVGEKYGGELSISPDFTDVSDNIPVPLHPKRQCYRGFNQSEEFGIGKGLLTVMTAQLYAYNLIRAVHTITQIRKSRWDRYKKVRCSLNLIPYS
jgi:predicted amidophosphoribosyltransferase